MPSPPRPIKALLWVASARKDYGRFPEDVQRSFGFELFLAQTGQHPPSAKPLKGLTPGTIELIEDHDGDTYRVVYMARLKSAIYVLHCFKKKSKSGIKTPQRELELVRRRLKDAEADDAERSIGGTKR